MVFLGLVMKKPRPQDLSFLAAALLAVAACAYYPVPTWMLVFCAALLAVVVIGLIGNLGLFERRQKR